MACVVDTDCPGTEVCYSGNEPWSVATHHGIAFCGCSSWYMWQGEPTCDTLSLGSYLALGFQIVVMMLDAVALVLTSLTVVKLRANKGSLRNAFAATLTLTWLGCFFILLHLVARIISITDPAGNTIVRDGEKLEAGYYLEYSSLPPALLCTTASFLNVSVVWSNAASASVMVSHARYKHLQRFWQKVIIALECLLIIGTVVLLAIGMMSYLPFWPLPFLVFIEIMTIMGSWRMHHTIEGLSKTALRFQSSSRRSKIQRSASLVLYTGMSMTIWSTITIVILIVYAYMFLEGWKNVSPIGEIAPLEFICVCVVLSATGMEITVATYLFKVVGTKATIKEHTNTESSSKDTAKENVITMPSPIQRDNSVAVLQSSAVVPKVGSS